MVFEKLRSKEKKKTCAESAINPLMKDRQKTCALKLSTAWEAIRQHPGSTGNGSNCNEW